MAGAIWSPTEIPKLAEVAAARTMLERTDQLELANVTI
jgi:hypothetical protein